MDIKIKFILLISIISSNIRAQDSSTFIIDSLTVENNIPITAFFAPKNNITPFFEDSKFLVSESCSGEWGGSLYFKDKSSEVIYECSSTCPLIINKLNDRYLITSNLAHLRGYWNVIEIKTPYELTKFSKREKKSINYVGDDESKSEKGSKIILEKHNQLALISFIYNNRLFHIFSDYKKTYVGEFINGELINIQILSKEPFYNYQHQIIKRENNHYLVLFQDSKSKGYLEIINNSIFIHKY